MPMLGLSIQVNNNRRWATIGIVSYQDDKITTISNFSKRLNLRLETGYFNNLLLDNLIRFKAPNKSDTNLKRLTTKKNGAVFRVQNTELLKHGKIEHINKSHSIIKLTTGRFQILPTSVLLNMASSGFINIA